MEKNPDLCSKCLSENTKTRAEISVVPDKNINFSIQ